MVISLAKKWNEILQSMFANYKSRSNRKDFPLDSSVNSIAYFLPKSQNEFIRGNCVLIDHRSMFEGARYTTSRRFQVCVFQEQGGKFYKTKGKDFYELTIRGSVPSARLQAVLSV